MVQMELQSGSHISLMSCTIDVVKHGVTWMVIRIKLYGDEVMHSKIRRCNGYFWEESGWRCTYAQSSPDWDL